MTNKIHKKRRTKRGGSIFNYGTRSLYKGKEYLYNKGILQLPYTVASNIGYGLGVYDEEVTQPTNHLLFDKNELFQINVIIGQFNGSISYSQLIEIIEHLYSSLVMPSSQYETQYDSSVYLTLLSICNKLFPFIKDEANKLLLSQIVKSLSDKLIASKELFNIRIMYDD